MSSSTFRVGILASGGGSNLQAILDRCLSGEIPATVAVVISNNSRSGALERARSSGIDAVHLSSKTHDTPDALDAAIDSTLKDHDVDLVALAGYMKKLGPRTLRRYQNRILNVHPSLLPAFGGRGMYGERVHKAVLASGASLTGVTVHLVDEEYDSGPIVAQQSVPVLKGETHDALARRVLEVEHAIYPAVIKRFAEGRVHVADGSVVIDGN